jgi:hypothetical protein
VFGRQPEHVGVEKKKEDEAEGEEIHVEAEEDTGLEEVPLRTSHAAEGVGTAEGCADDGEDQEGVCAVVGESGEKIGDPEAAEDEDAASQKGPFMRIEDAGFHAWFTDKDRLWLPFVAMWDR